MKTIQPAIVTLFSADAQPAGWAVLLDITLQDSNHLRYARYASDITYDGNVYTAWPSGGEWLIEAKTDVVPVVNLVLPDAVRLLRPYAIENEWFRYCTVTVVVLCVTQLAADYDWSTVTYDIWEASPQDESITLRLGGPNIAQMRFPPERYYSRTCAYVRGFKSDPRCGYDGVETSCNGTLARCEELSNEERYGGWLGLDPEGAPLVLPPGLRGLI